MSYNTWKSEVIKKFALHPTHYEYVPTSGWDVVEPHIYRKVYKAKNGTEYIFAYRQLISITRVKGRTKMDSAIDSFQ